MLETKAQRREFRCYIGWGLYLGMLSCMFSWPLGALGMIAVAVTTIIGGSLITAAALAAWHWSEKWIAEGRE